MAAKDDFLKMLLKERNFEIELYKDFTTAQQVTCGKN